MRKLKEKSITLDELGKMLKISKERVRQIETKALEKLKIAILDISQQNKEFFVWYLCVFLIKIDCVSFSYI